MSDQQKLETAEKLLIEKSLQMTAAGQDLALKVFHQVAASTPLYQKHLENNGIHENDVKTIGDWAIIPPIDKNFLKDKSITNICPDQSDIYAYSLSSGSAGQRQLFPRSKSGESNIEPAFTQMWTAQYQIDQKRTLIINAWALGLTSAGTALDWVFRNMAQKNPNIRVLSPGAVIDEIIVALEIAHQLRHQDFEGKPLVEQVILQGYPPNTVEAVRKFKEKGFDPKKLNLKMIVGGEGHSVEWLKAMQTLISEKGEDDLSCMISLLGTSESGVTALDTELSVLIRKLAHQNPEFASDLFGTKQVIPMFFQYLAHTRFLETTPDGELMVTCPAGTPVIRYNLHDRGQTYTMEHIFSLAKRHGYNLLQELVLRGYDPARISPFPFLAHFGRADGAVSIDGAVTFPANVEPILVHDAVSQQGITKFMLDIDEDTENHRRQLLVHLELDEGKDPTDLNQQQLDNLRQIITQTIAASNGDYAISLRENPDSALPQIKIHPKDQGPFAFNKGRTKHRRIHKD